MAEKMDKFDLLKEKLRGNEEIAYRPLALWKHFPQHDQDPRLLAEIHIDFQKRLDLDLLKISPHGRYPVIDLGCELGEIDPISGSRRCKRCIISETSDWEEIEEIDVSSGEYGKQLTAYERIADELADEVPLLATVFSPFMVASKMDPKLLDHVRENPDAVRDGLVVLTRITKEYARASLEMGVHGIFLASQHYTKAYEESFVREWENTWIKLVLDGIKTKSEVTVFHLHGLEPRLELSMRLPAINGWNWHDQVTEPTLVDVEQKIRRFGIILGGIRVPDKKIDVENQYLQKLKSVLQENSQLRRWYVAPGCVLPQWLTDDDLDLLRQVVRASNEYSH